MNLFRKIKESIVWSILLPIVAIALVVSVITVSYLIRAPKIGMGKLTVWK